MKHIDDIYDLLLHSVRVAFLAQTISVSLNINNDISKQMFVAGLFHDIGKLGVDQQILHKKDKISHEEYEYLKGHVAIGSIMMCGLPFSDTIINSVLQHHESLNGDGYPKGLSGDEICFGAKIIKACDVFDALISKRPYRPGYSIEKAIEIMNAEKEKYDLKVLTMLFDIVRTNNG